MAKGKEEKGKEEGLGKEILSLCGRCKLALAHTIITMTKKGVADRCECNTCGAKHKYRDPDKPKRAVTKRAPRKVAVPIEVLWSEAVSNTKSPARSYKMSGDFAQGDLIEHSTFGKGVVQELLTATKIKVLFETSEKILVHNR